VSKTYRQIKKEEFEKKKDKYLAQARQAVAEGKKLTWTLVRGEYYLVAGDKWIARRHNDAVATWFHFQLVNEGLIEPGSLADAICHAHDEDLAIGGILYDDLASVIFQEDE
jgi:hypothetical protein